MQVGHLVMVDTVNQSITLDWSTGSIPRRYGFYGRQSGPIWLSYLSCTGNETSLLNCSHHGIGYSYCNNYYDDVGVQCPGDIINPMIARSTQLINSLHLIVRYNLGFASLLSRLHTRNLVHNLKWVMSIVRMKCCDFRNVWKKLN